AKSANIKIDEWKQDKKDIVVVVDGANDITLFDICELGIAFRAQDVVKDLATVTLEQKDLSLLIDIINKHYKTNLQVPTVA
ncbi:MAG: phosphoserine phosphatase SerB, partial [Nitrosopumilaceae archaeon]